MKSSQPNSHLHDPVIDQFIDSVWMEHGLSKNTLTAYRTDLRKTAEWLASQARGDLINVQRTDLLDYLAPVRARIVDPADGAGHSGDLYRFARWPPGVRHNIAREAPRVYSQL